MVWHCLAGGLNLDKYFSRVAGETEFECYASWLFTIEKTESLIAKNYVTLCDFSVFLLWRIKTEHASQLDPLRFSGPALSALESVDDRTTKISSGRLLRGRHL
jgi:hypothetical protein